MVLLLDDTAAFGPDDAKTYREHAFRVPAETKALRLEFRYDRGGDLPHNLLTLSLFDPAGFRGAAHRFAPRQVVELDPARATPGFLAGELPPGPWTAEVALHGVIAGGGYSLKAEARPPVPAVGPPSRSGAAAARPGPLRWLRGELHLHSDHSDGRWSVEEMAAHARGRGLDFLFLTDHNTVSGVDALREAVGDGMAVLPGTELTTFRGHALALGPGRWVDWRTGRRGRTIDAVARDVRDAGGLFVVAHPDAPPDEVCTGCRWTHADFDPALADAVEVWGGLWDGPEERNEGCLALWRAWLNAGHRLAATGATDAHRPEDWVGPVPLTYVEAESASLPAILAGLRAGRTYVSSGPGLSLEGRRTDGSRAGLGETLVPRRGDGLVARCSAAPRAELRLVAQGQTLARARVEGEAGLEAAPGPGHRWACAELWREDGAALLAVTSPIYLRGE